MDYDYPAIVVGGPPHSGKSVLVHALSKALRKHDIAHYVLRATPDGEGDWAYEIDQALVRTLRKKGQFTHEFIEHTIHALNNRPMPFIVDAGGKPTDWQEGVFTACTHGIVLIADNKEPTRDRWHQLYAKHNVRLIADLTSTLTNQESIDATATTLQGTIAKLERERKVIESPVLDALVSQLCNILTLTDTNMERVQLATAPVQAAFSIRQLASSVEVAHDQLQPHHLPQLDRRLPSNCALALYGLTRGWVYGFMAARTGSADFWQFDGRRGWIQPPTLRFSTTPQPSAWQQTITAHADYSIVTFSGPSQYFSASNLDHFPVSSLPASKGVIISGQLPYWLTVALVKLYQPHHPWIACFQPGPGAIVVTSKSAAYPLGKIVP